MRRALTGIAVLVLALAGAGAAAGAITIVVSQSASTSTTLDGQDHEAALTVDVTVGGAKTTGWNIVAWAPLPSNGTHNLPKLAVTSQPSDDPCTGRNCVQPSPTGISWPVQLGTSSGAAAKVYNADVNTGTGTVTIHVPIGVTVPSNAYAGTYTTTVTFTISNSSP